jgi:hypothetical protein
METRAVDILAEDGSEPSRPLCERCGLPLIVVNYGTLELTCHADPDECERTYEAERGSGERER